jgi:hypothetical protein
MKFTWLDTIGKAAITAIKAKTDNLPDSPADETTVDLVQTTVDLVEDHFHSKTRFLGARAGWDGTNEVNAASNDSLTPFTLDAGNDTWGDPLCTLGSDDTPVQSGMTYFDHRFVTITQTERNTLYRIRFAWGADYASAIAADDFSEWEFIPLSGGQDSGPWLVYIPRIAAGTKMFAATWCLGANTGTISFTYGLHEYPS